MARQAERKALAAHAWQPDRLQQHPATVQPLTAEVWRTATKSPFYKPVKLAAAVHADSDVLLRLKGQGKGYQTRMNAILRDAILRAIHQKI